MVTSQTRSELIENITGAIGSAAQELFVRRRDQQILQEQAQYDREIAELRSSSSPMSGATSSSSSSASSESSTPPSLTPLEQANALARELDGALAEAEAEQDCELCQALIAATRRKSTSKQRKILPELNAFLSAVENGEDREEMTRRIKQSDHLSALLEEEIARADRVADVADAASSRQRSRDRDRDHNDGDHTSESFGQQQSLSDM